MLRHWPGAWFVRVDGRTGRIDMEGWEWAVFFLAIVVAGLIFAVGFCVGRIDANLTMAIEILEQLKGVVP